MFSSRRWHIPRQMTGNTNWPSRSQSLNLMPIISVMRMEKILMLLNVTNEQKILFPSKNFDSFHMDKF
jgi:hypothetical protein